MIFLVKLGSLKKKIRYRFRFQFLKLQNKDFR